MEKENKNNSDDYKIEKISPNDDYDFSIYYKSKRRAKKRGNKSRIVDYTSDGVPLDQNGSVFEYSNTWVLSNTGKNKKGNKLAMMACNGNYFHY